jgi:hypothetical protein
MHWYVQYRNLCTGMCNVEIYLCADTTSSPFKRSPEKMAFSLFADSSGENFRKNRKKEFFFFWRKRWHDNSSIFETFQACVTFAASEGRIDEKFDKKIVRQKTCATRNDPTRAKTHLLPSQRDFGRLGQKVDHTAKFHATYLCMRFSRWHLSAAQKRLRKRVIF